MWFFSHHDWALSVITYPALTQTSGVRRILGVTVVASFLIFQLRDRVHAGVEARFQALGVVFSWMGTARGGVTALALPSLLLCVALALTNVACG